MKRARKDSRPPVHTFSLTGDLTIYTVAAAKTALLSELQAAPSVALDLSQVGEIDTAGLQLLIFAKREAERLSKSLSVVAPSTAVTALLDFCNAAQLCGLTAAARQ